MSDIVIDKNYWNCTSDKFAQVFFLEKYLIEPKTSSSDNSPLIDLLNLFNHYWMKPVTKLIDSPMEMEFNKDTMDQFKFVLHFVYDLPIMYTIMKDTKIYKLYNPKSFSILYNDGTTRYPNRIINMELVKQILDNIPTIYNIDGTITNDIKDQHVISYINIQNEIIREALPDLFETIYMIPQIDGINRSGLSGITNLQDINICIGERFDSTGRVVRSFLNLDKILVLAAICRYYDYTRDGDRDLMMYNIIYGFSANIYARHYSNIPKYIVSNAQKVMDIVLRCNQEDFMKKDYLSKQIEILQMMK